MFLTGLDGNKILSELGLPNIAEGMKQGSSGGFVAEFWRRPGKRHHGRWREGLGSSEKKTKDHADAARLQPSALPLRRCEALVFLPEQPKDDVAL
jgi:hypothetical protein